MNLLLVDDEPEIREMLGDIFESWGHTVTRACNGNQARQQLIKKKFDLIITDLKMANGTGFDLAEWIQHQNLNIAIIGISGYVEQSDEELLKIGFYKVISKPINFKKLKGLVEAIDLELKARRTA